jgi:hypothetical protein
VSFILTLPQNRVATALFSNPKEISSRKGLLSKGANPRGMLVGSPKERVSIAMN